MLVMVKMEFPDIRKIAGGVEDPGLSGMTCGLEDELGEAG